MTAAICSSDSATPSASMPADRTCADKVLRVAGSLIVSSSAAPSRSVSSSEGIELNGSADPFRQTAGGCASFEELCHAVSPQQRAKAAEIAGGNARLPQHKNTACAEP